MKLRNLLLASTAAIGIGYLPSAASAQCIGIGTVNSAPLPGMNCNMDSSLPTYAATSIGLVPGSAPTDIACLTGSATKTIRLKQIRISGTAGTAINIVAVITKHASANSGGTLATSTALPVPYALDSTFAAPSATTQAWTANPTINDASPGLLDAADVFLPVTSTAVGAPPVTTFFGGVTYNSPVLRGIAQQICVNLNAATAPSSGLMTVEFVWTEQAQ